MPRAASRQEKSFSWMSSAKAVKALQVIWSPAKSPRPMANFVSPDKIQLHTQRASPLANCSCPQCHHSSATTAVPPPSSPSPSQPRNTLLCPWRASGNVAPKAWSLGAKDQTLPHREIWWSEIFSGKSLGNKSFEVSGSDLHRHVALAVIQTAWKIDIWSGLVAFFKGRSTVITGKSEQRFRGTRTSSLFKVWNISLISSAVSHK